MTELERELRESLRVTLASLFEHVSQEAHELNIPAGELCPCLETTIKDAEALLARVSD